MNSVEKIISLCKENNIPISRLEKECNFANGYISGLKKGVLPSDRLVKVANYLNVSVDSLNPDSTPKPKNIIRVYRINNNTITIVLIKYTQASYF